MQYEVESIGARRYYFTNDNYPDIELVARVGVWNTSQDDELDNQAYGLLQAVHPTTWHDWRLQESVDDF